MIADPLSLPALIVVGVLWAAFNLFFKGPPSRLMDAHPTAWGVLSAALIVLTSGLWQPHIQALLPL